jgi:sphingolipid delta-4 desaturase
VEPPSKIRRGAPGLYDSLVYHTSWTRLLIRFVSDPNICLFSRQARTARGHLALNAEINPDIEFLHSERLGGEQWDT